MRNSDRKLVEIPIREFIQDFQTQTEAAQALGVARSTFHDMVTRNDMLLIAEYEGGAREFISRLDYVGGKNNHNIQYPSNVRKQAAEKAKTQLQVKEEKSAEAEKELEAEQRRGDDLELKCRTLTSELNKAKKERLITEEVRQHILGLTEQPIGPADWLISRPDSMYGQDRIVGVPTLMISDIHAGEKVFPTQVFGKNEYNMEIARERIRELTRRSVNVLQNHMVAPDGYPGIVVNLAGDLVSGDIHDELTATNDKPTLPCVLELVNSLISMLQSLIANFGRVMVFSVPGNHGRTTQKIQAKNFAYTNYDWLVSCLLERFFQEDDRIHFYITDQADIQYKIYDHRYRLTHGNQFRGGQGFVGAFAPIARGDKKKRSSASSYGMEYDTLALGHFHQLWMPGQVIVNGSVIGFNEFALSNNFDYEVPKQAMWITHPDYGITYSIPVFCERPDKGGRQDNDAGWVNWYEE